MAECSARTVLLLGARPLLVLALRLVLRHVERPFRRRPEHGEPRQPGGSVGSCCDVNRLTCRELLAHREWTIIGPCYREIGPCYRSPRARARADTKEYEKELRDDLEQVRTTGLDGCGADSFSASRRGSRCFERGTKAPPQGGLVGRDVRTSHLRREDRPLWCVDSVVPRLGFSRIGVQCDGRRTQCGIIPGAVLLLCSHGGEAM